MSKTLFTTHPTGPWVSGAWLDYIVTDFPKWLIREYHMLFPDKPRTLAPISMAKLQCKK